MKPIKINDSYLDKVLAQDMLEPSITKILKGGHVYAYASFEFEFKQEKIFKRRKVLRLIRKHKREYKKVYVDGVLFYVKKSKSELRLKCTMIIDKEYLRKVEKEPEPIWHLNTYNYKDNV